MGFQSTSPVRGTTAGLQEVDQEIKISIHVPREGDDHAMIFSEDAPKLISIHVPREGDDDAKSIASIR